LARIPAGKRRKDEENWVQSLALWAKDFFIAFLLPGKKLFRGGEK